MTALVEESRQLALDLHRAFRDIDRARWRAEARAIAAQQLSELRGRIDRMHKPRGADPIAHALWPRLAEVRTALANTPALEDGRRAWVAFRARILPAYESMAASLRAWSMDVPSVRPTNYARNAFHVLSASLAVVTIELVPSWSVVIALAFALAVYAWSMEILRRRSAWLNGKLMKFFAPVAHPHEVYRVNSSTWYVTALAALSLTGQLVPCAIALIALGFGDPAAALVGRRFGRIPLIHGRTVEGTLAFIGVSALVGTVLLVFAHGMTLGMALAIAAAGSAAGAMAELLARRIDDNLSIPLVAWLGAAAAAALL